jgi:hydroxyacylglutathione hydrolase
MPAALCGDEVDSWAAQGALIIDVRSAWAFRAGHIPAAVAAGANGNVSGWIGWLVGPERSLVLVAEAGRAGASQVAEAGRQLARIGYDQVVGYLDGGYATWVAAERHVASYETTNASELAQRLDADEAVVVLDVREAAEWHLGHIPGSVNLPAHEIPSGTPDLPRGVPLAVHCGHEYRATLGASLLERAGYDNLSVLDDGWDGWAALASQA